MWCDHAFYVGATADNVAELPDLERLPGVCGVKIFMGASTGDLLTADDETLEKILASGQRRVAVHAEDEPRMQERRHIAEQSNGDPAAHPIWRDEESALKATGRLVALARKTGRQVHVLHITTAAEMKFLAENKDIASVEATPQHLTLEAPGCYAELGSKAQMNPPIRDGENRAGLWWGLAQGVVDVIGSDHAPHTLQEKAQTYPDSPSGMPGVQTLLPIMLDHVAAGRLSLMRLMDLTSAGATRLFGLKRKGRIAVGYDADFALVDLVASREITDQMMANKSGWTPFAGKTVTGWPMATIIRGEAVMRDGEVLGKAIGEPLRFHATAGAAPGDG
jgi:dihydroorotase